MEGGALNKRDVAMIHAALDAVGWPREAEPEVWRINAKGFALIKESEGCVLSAYRDAVGVLTIGYGSTGPHVKPGMVITQEQADQLLLDDLDRFERAVSNAAHNGTDNQLSAMVSLAFNVGTTAFLKSTLLRLHNSGDYAGAQAQFGRWNRAGGRVLRGLTIRRAKEAALYGEP